jgi:hypothetical protein
MSVIKREYLCCQYDHTPPPTWEGDHWETKPYPLPDWFVNALPQYKRIIRVLGATGGMIDVESGVEPDEAPRGIRLMSNLTKDFPSNKFVMMMNKYNCVKEFDITYNNIRELTFWTLDGINKPFPAPGVHMDLVIELELMIVNGDFD